MADSTGQSAAITSQLDPFRLAGVRRLTITLTRVIMGARLLSHITLPFAALGAGASTSAVIAAMVIGVDLVIGIRPPVVLDDQRIYVSIWLVGSSMLLLLTQSPKTNAVYGAATAMCLVAFLADWRGLVAAIGLLIAVDAVALQRSAADTAELVEWYRGIDIDGSWFYVIRWASIAIIGAAGFHFARMADGWARAALEERERVKRDLHDTVAKTIIGVGLLAESLPDAPDRASAVQLSREIRRGVQLSLGEARRIVDGIGMTRIEELPEAIRLHAQRQARLGRLPIEVHTNVEVDVPSPISTEIFAIAVEAVSNLRRHSAADRAWIVLDVGLTGAVLVIGDDGSGADVSQPADIDETSFGLRSMGSRAGRLGGSLTVSSAPGRGFVIQADVPFDATGPFDGDTGAFVPAPLDGLDGRITFIPLNATARPPTPSIAHRAPNRR
ncbi:MAG: histidine kinase [Actinomycetota bacterium]